tara:strand:- start:37 stop:891 length:855 start_codon:yes stop_codon:yes gene_type:complete
MGFIKKFVNFFVSNKKFGLLFKKEKAKYKEVIDDLIEEQNVSDKEIDDGTKKIFSNVIDIHDKHVENVMVPRANIIAISEDENFEKLSELMTRCRHSRIPTYSKNLDKITGMIHIRDFFNYVNKVTKKMPVDKNIKKIIRKVLFASPSMKILDLLLKMRSEKIHMAIVVDEFGGTDGLITIEDLVEEIVGEIEDEHDVSQREYFKKISKGNFELSSRMLMDEFEKVVGMKINIDEKIDTVGGLVFSLAERVPERGEVIEFSEKLEFTILEADTRRIKRLAVKKK